MFEIEAIRLIREKWKDIQMLAEETYAVFQTKIPTSSNSSTTINNEAPGAGLTINPVDGAGPAISFNKKPLPNYTFQNAVNAGLDLAPSFEIPGMGDSSIKIGMDGGIIIFAPSFSMQIGDTLYDLSGTTPNSQPPPYSEPSGQKAVSNSFPCKVVKGGPGALYDADIYVAGPLGGATRIKVTQLSIPNDETIPPNVWTIATKNGDKYYMQADQPSAIPGQIVSGGPGSTYTLEVWPWGLDGASKQVTVHQLSIPDDETIPPQAWALVARVGDQYAMQLEPPSCIPGKVLSGGPGDTYQVEVYPWGMGWDGAPKKTVEVKQLQIASDATIPAGTWTMVSRYGDEYRMQVPVWLEEPTP